MNPQLDFLIPFYTQSDNEEGSDSKHETKENESDLEKEEDVKDDDEKEEEFIHTPSQSDDENDDAMEGDKDKGMDFVKEAGLNEHVHVDEEVQEGVDVEMTKAQQGNENVEITQEQVIEVAKVTTTDDPKETEKSFLYLTFQFSMRYVVPTGRVVVPTGRYVVPAGKVIIIVSPGRLSLVPTGRVK
ncbi:hypothetical protein Tco_1275998 [Tanacetum coccineum]